MKNLRNLLLAASITVISAAAMAQANQATNPAGPPSSGTGATTTPTRGTGAPLSDPNAVNRTSVPSSGQSNDPYVQKRQADSEARADYKDRKKAAKQQAKMEKKHAKAELKAEKAQSTAERNDALAPAATVK
jgi:hypothetical protein